MKAMIFFSIGTLMPVVALEHRALMQALKQNGRIVPWTVEDHASLLQSATTLSAITSLAREVPNDRLVDTYLDHLDQLLEGYDTAPDERVLDRLDWAHARGVRCILVSDYPLQTMNLARSAALHTNATRVRDVLALPDAHRPCSMTARLISLLHTQGLAPAECIAVVSGRRDARTARELGLLTERLELDLVLSREDACRNPSLRPPCQKTRPSDMPTAIAAYCPSSAMGHEARVS